MRNRSGVGLRCAVALCCLWLSAGDARAQSAADAVAELNRVAMEAYANLDIQKAGSSLEEALGIAYQNQDAVPGSLVAQTHANMAVVLIGGLNDRDAGLSHFIRAVCIDANVPLDPLTSSPEIQQVFQAAHQQAAGGACGGAPAPPSGPGPAGPGRQPPPPPDQAILHYAPGEITPQTPMPLYAEVHPATHPKRMFLYYKGLGMEDYKRVPMFVFQNGFAYQISCEDVWEPNVRYYLEALNDDDKIVGVAGSATQPIVVPVVAQPSQAPPALPNTSPPGSCAAGECPPGVKGCKKPGMAAIGASCEEQKDCQGGLSCEDDECILPDTRGTEAPDVEEGESWAEGGSEGGTSGFRSGFLHLGLAVGGSVVQAGMEADRESPREIVFVNQFGTYVGHPEPIASQPNALHFPEPGQANENMLTPWLPDADSSDSQSPLGGNCSADGTATGPQAYAASGGDPEALYPSKYCVRVKTAGLVPTMALRAGLGYFVADDVSLAAIFRYQFSAGQGSFASMLLGARVEYLLGDPRASGFVPSFFGGATFGQIQVKPPADSEDGESPFAISGPVGAHIGTNLRVRMHPNAGIVIAPEVDLQFPAVLLNLDLTVAAEAAF